MNAGPPLFFFLFSLTPQPIEQCIHIHGISSTSVSFLWTYPQRHIQRFISYVILNSVQLQSKLTITDS